jgi:hypothetical protein
MRFDFDRTPLTVNSVPSGQVIPAVEQVQIEDVDPDFCYAVFISYVEIYNNYVYDLLDEEQISANRLLVDYVFVVHAFSDELEIDHT